MRKAMVCGLAACLYLWYAACYAMDIRPVFQPLLGPEKAKGVFVWSHGRDPGGEDSKSPAPPFLAALRDDGWDVERFDRKTAEDNLQASPAALLAFVKNVKQDGYRSVVLGGQSFGAFVALTVAAETTLVDKVIGTAPAANGYQEKKNWNAWGLYQLLKRLQSAEVMLFFFEGDIYDPGGRAEGSRGILAERKPGFVITDRPQGLRSHWAISDMRFAPLYAPCIVAFSDAESLTGDLTCVAGNGTLAENPSKRPKVAGLQ